MSSGTRDLAHSYNELPYESEIHRSVHPIRLSSAAQLRGIETAAIDGCRVLEFGCAQATDLVLIADAYPDASFVGLELAERHVEVARERVRDLDLKNVQILHGDIEQFDESLGPFDYIICHGIYSWIPESVRSRMLELCGRLLAPGGVANVSYNVLPGWHAKRDLRNLLIAAIKSVHDVRERPVAARKVLAELHTGNSSYDTVMAHHIQAAMRAPDWYLAHDYLEVVNHPVYLTDFVQHAAFHGLRYLDDLTVTSELPFSGRDGDIPRTADDVASQQQADILRGCAFRSAVLCREDEVVTDSISLDRLVKMHVASQLKPVVGDSTGHRFSIGGKSDSPALTVEDPALAMSLTILGQIFPRSTEIGRLLTVTADRGIGVGHADEFADRVARLLVGLSSSHPLGDSPIEVLAEPFKFVSTVSERPEISRAARYFVAHGYSAMSRRHDVAGVEDVVRFVLQQFDGSRTVHDVAEIVFAEYLAGRLSTPNGFLENAENDHERRRLARRLTEDVIETSKNGLLVR